MKFAEKEDIEKVDKAESMKLIIEIPDSVYKSIQKNSLGVQAECYVLENAVLNGVPLSKGHGRLFDERDIVNGNYEVIGNRIYELEPIIEADKVENEG